MQTTAYAKALQPTTTAHHELAFTRPVGRPEPPVQAPPSPSASLLDDFGGPKLNNTPHRQFGTCSHPLELKLAMIDQAAPDTPPDALIDLPLQPTGSGVADLEIADEQMKVAQGDGAGPTSDLAEIEASQAYSLPHSATSGDGRGSMELIRLPVGEPAEVDTDCIRIEELEGGKHRLTGSALCVAEDAGSSVSLMNGLTYLARDDAEAAGVVWANSVGVRRLYITVGTLDRPLRLTEIDLPG